MKTWELKKSLWTILNYNKNFHVGNNMKKNSVLKDMWIAFRKDDRPHWEIMADDGMNKFLKFCITCVFLYFGYVTVLALIERFV